MNFYYKLFFLIPDFRNFGTIGKIINKIISKVFSFIINNSAKNCYHKNTSAEKYQLDKEKRKNELIVSLTAIPSRIDNVWITLESILRQTYKPDRIILWLAKDDFGEKELPHSLLKLKPRGVEIKYCENLRSHDKYYHTIINNPNATVITVDDDTIYPNNIISNLIQMHKEFPYAVCANLASLVSYKKGIILPYRKWKECYKKELKPTHKIILIGVGGVLYPPNALSKICFDKELIKQLSFGADDIWLNTMCLINDTPIVTNETFNRYYLAIRGSQKITLLKFNSIQGGNDKYLDAVHKYFKISEKDYNKEILKSV